MKFIKVYNMERSTIEAKHSEKMQQFVDPNHECEIKKKETELKNATGWKERNRINNEIETLKRLNTTKSTDDMYNYLLDVTPILHEYQCKNHEQTSYTTNGFTSNSIHNKGTMYKKYMNIVENQPIRAKQEEISYICQECRTTRLFDAVESILTCPNCGYSNVYFDVTAQGDVTITNAVGFQETYHVWRSTNLLTMSNLTVLIDSV